MPDMFLPIPACAVFFVRPITKFEKDPYWDWRTGSRNHEIQTIGLASVLQHTGRFAHARKARLTRHAHSTSKKSENNNITERHTDRKNATNIEIIMFSKWFGKPRSQTKDNTKVECPQLSLRPSKEGNKVAILASG